MHFKLGKRGNIFRDSLERIRGNILEVLNNPVYKENVDALKKLTDKKYNHQNFYEILDGKTAAIL